LRVAFAGTPDFALPALAALLKSHQLVGVLTREDKPAGRGRKLSASPVKRAALAAALPLAQPRSLREAAGRAALESWAPEALVVVAYGLMLPEEVLSLPRYGCLNIHASLLPRWRGAAPIQRALLAGDTTTGVTIMQMEQGLDTGPVLLQKPLAIRADHTSGSLHAELAQLGAVALIETLEGLPRGALKPTPQPAAGITYAAKIGKAEARIDWHSSAPAIERAVRAFYPWPVAETVLAGEPLRILSAEAEQALPDSPEHDANVLDPGSIVAVHDDFIRVRCGTGYLRIKEVQRPGRRPVGARDFSHGAELQGRRFG
jgi:methionyl-tRNA formyltransferase